MTIRGDRKIETGFGVATNQEIQAASRGYKRQGIDQLQILRKGCSLVDTDFSLARPIELLTSRTIK